MSPRSILVLLTLLTLTLSLSTTATARPALPPPPTLVTAAPQPGGAWRIAWRQASDAPIVILSARGFTEARPGATEHTVVIPGAFGWQAGEAVTIFEQWPGSPLPDEIYPVTPIVLDKQTYLPALADGGAPAAAAPAARAVDRDEPPPLARAGVVLAGGRLTAFWDAPDGQQLVCVIHLANRAPIDRCHRGPGGLLRLAVPGDVNLQVAPGDLVEVRVWGVSGPALGVSEVAVADRWATALPWVELAQR